MVSFNIILINVNFVTIHKTVSSSAKIRNFFWQRIPETSLKYKLGVLAFHCV